MTCLRSYNESERIRTRTQVFNPLIPKLGTELTWVGGSVELCLCARYKVSFCLYQQDLSIICQVQGYIEGWDMVLTCEVLVVYWELLLYASLKVPPDKAPDVCVV